MVTARSSREGRAKVRSALALGPEGADRPWSRYFSNGPTREYGYYGSGFLDAARVLGRSLRRRRGISNVDPLPVLFMYRHSIELLAKAVILSGNRLMQAHGDGRPEQEVFADFASSRHRLLPLLTAIRQTFDYAGWQWFWPRSAVTTFDDAWAAASALEELDPDSFNFRYPTNLRGESGASQERIVGLHTVLTVLDDLAEALDTAVEGLDAQASTV